MAIGVVDGGEGVRLAGDWEGAADANRFLGHLRTRAFSAATVRAYAFDLVNLARLLQQRRLGVAEMTATDVFDWIEWQRTPPPAAGTVVALRQRGAAIATVNRRVAAARGFFGFLVMAGKLTASPVPAGRRGAGLRPAPRGLLGHLGPGRPRGGGRLLREPSRLPESLPLADVGAFLGDLRYHRDRAVVRLMLLGGLRAGEVRGPRLADVDQGRRRVRVLGKGVSKAVGRARVAPIEEGQGYFPPAAQRGYRMFGIHEVLRLSLVG